MKFASALRQTIMKELHLPISFGLSINNLADHFAGDFQAADQRVTEIRMAVATRSMCQVRTVHASGIDTYQQVGWAQVWIGSICHCSALRLATNQPAAVIYRVLPLFVVVK